MNLQSRHSLLIIFFDINNMLTRAQYINPIWNYLGQSYIIIPHSNKYSVRSSFYIFFYDFLSFQISSVIIFPQCFRYLTTMQLAQFATFFVHASLPLFIECDFPKFFSYVILFHGAMFFLLFANFYIQSYIKKRPSKSTSNGVHSNGIKTDINGNGILKKDQLVSELKCNPSQSLLMLRQGSTELCKSLVVFIIVTFINQLPLIMQLCRNKCLKDVPHKLLTSFEAKYSF